jgi:hypothetical protein
MQAAALKSGDVYFGLRYEDESYTRFIIQNYEYLGKRASDDESGEAIYLFRLLPLHDELELKEGQLDLILDLEGLIDELQSAGGSR